MDFSTIGTVSSYVQQKNLKFAANFKKQTGQSIVNSSGNLQLELKRANNKSLAEKMIQANQTEDSEYVKQRVSSIRRKLLNGKKISNEELGYLKKNDPDLYKKAKKAEESREELKAALRKAKTKQEARQAVTRALVKASSEALAELSAAKSAAGISGGGNINGNAAGYEASQEIGGPNAEAIQAFENGDDAALARINEQITAKATENNFDSSVDIEASKLKDINSEIAATNEINAENAIETAAAETNEMINKPNDQKSDQTNFSQPSSPLSNGNSKNDPVSGIMEKFIMVVRAIEDEWITFAKSDEFKELAEDLFEEAEIDQDGKHKRKNKISIDIPNQQVMDVITAYRNSMMFDKSSVN
ncbi:MAG: hypothetical protein IJ728_06280 [Selenomonadaceae bacterium]|nr:hypothetical protein [Selenomonadaceae bacterium]